MSVYKATARKWIKDRKLQTWFNSLAGEKRTKHFQKHRLINKTKSKGMRGKKILVLSTAFSKQSRRIAKRIHWRDWNVYKAEMSDKGLTVADARKQWNLDLMTQGVPNKKENGVRKIGKYLGDFEDEVQEDGNIQEEQQAEEVNDKDALTSARQELAEKKKKTQATLKDYFSAMVEPVAFEDEEQMVDERLMTGSNAFDPSSDTSTGFDMMFEDNEEHMARLEEAMMEEEELDAQKFEAAKDGREESIIRAEFTKAAGVVKLRVDSARDEKQLDADNVLNYIKNSLFRGAEPDAIFTEMIKVHPPPVIIFVQ
jgi:hypothetical protein